MNAPAKSNEDLVYAVEGGIARLTFNRPQARNALTFAMYERMLCRFSAGFIGWTSYLVGRAISFGAPRGMTAASGPGWTTPSRSSPSARRAAFVSPGTRAGAYSRNHAPLPPSCAAWPRNLGRRPALAPVAAGKYVAFAGIGRPVRFFDALQRMPGVELAEAVPFISLAFLFTATLTVEVVGALTVGTAGLKGFTYVAVTLSAVSLLP